MSTEHGGYRERKHVGNGEGDDDDVVVDGSLVVMRIVVALKAVLLTKAIIKVEMALICLKTVTVMVMV